MEGTCTCGSQAVHKHRVNGSDLFLCPDCNSVFYLLRHNHTGQHLRLSISMIEKEGDDNFLDRCREMPPEMFEESTTKETTPNTPPPAKVHIVNHSDETDSNSCYRVIPDDFEMTLRKPPVLAHNDD